MKYKFKKLKTQEILRIKDMSIAMQYGNVHADRRIQVVMPKEVVEALDQTFPNVDRSKILTQLAIEAILEKQYFADRPDLEKMAKAEQAGLDTMWQYLVDREHHD